MTTYLRLGLGAAWRQPFATTTLFLYQMAWSMLLYKLIQGVLVPLMHRFPGSEQPKQAMQLWLAESQFQLMKTDLTHSYLWLLAILLGLRMLMTPLLNSGVYYSLTHPDLNAGYRFFRGIKELMLPFLLVYVIRMALTLAPLLWIVPHAGTIFSHSSSYEQLALRLLPWALGLLAYSFVLQLLFMHVQFAIAAKIGILSAVISYFRYLLPILGLALLLLLLSGVVAGAAAVSTYIWAGLAALIIYQMLPILHIFIQLWSLASQYQLLSAKIPN